MITRGLVRSRTGQIHYIEAGTGPQVVVLVPQAGRSSQMYLELVERLGEHVRAIALDVPGTGASDTAPAGLEIADYGASLVDALDELEIGRFTLFGLHGGNKIATAIAVRHPHRVTGLVVAGQSHSIVPSNAERAAAFARTPSITSVVSAEEAEDGSALLWSREFRDLAAIWWADGVVSPPSSAAQTAAVAAAVESLQAVLHRPHFYRAAFAYDLEGEFAALRVPTLFLELVTPKEDREFGRQGEALLAHVPGSTLQVLEFTDPSYAVTLEDSAEELAGILLKFAGETTQAD
jgi:pimeloyl-ACP methyl ester carboxylesterase